MVSILQFENIHIQVSYLPEEAECKEDNFQILQSETEYCFAWKHYQLEQATLEAQVDLLVTQYREHNELGDSVPVYVGIWFVTPNEEPGLLIQFEPEKPKLTVIKGGKNE